MKYFTVKQVADKLQVHPQTIRRKIKSGEMESYLVGNKYRISKKQLKEYIENTNKT
ncbi:MAG: helix-turn-helix domain-containing protein [archaeon]